MCYRINVHLILMMNPFEHAIYSALSMLHIHSINITVTKNLEVEYFIKNNSMLNSRMEAYNGLQISFLHTSIYRLKSFM